MNKSESKYYNTACLMDEALILLLEKKDFEFITVKEICEKAGVNRSTFYLHYETMTDLLEESTQYFLKKFYLQMQETDDFNMADGERGISKHIESAPKDDLYLVSAKYLVPYLQFIKENRRIFGTVLNRAKLFGWENVYNFMFDKIFSPIMDRFGVPNDEKLYMVSFCVHGLTAIVKQWIDGGCVDDVRKITEIMQKCAGKR